MTHLIKKSGFYVASVLFLTVAFTFTNAGDKPSDKKEDVLSVIEQRADLTTFDKIVKTAEMEKTLKEDGPYTVFVPTNQAFLALDQETMTKLTTDKKTAEEFVSQHVIKASLSSDQLTNDTKVKSLNGKEIAITADGGFAMLGGAEVVESDIPAANGILHIVNGCINSKKES